ncbi:hypothetical protein [Spirillospora sp. NPDC048824]|uniref:hypothetical protein n=1 Tax=Spirillospora sp. NPDC048824 TaxID=3364526 RepID=UPI00371928A1
MRPDGSTASQSGFDTKQAALHWGEEQEAGIRRHRWNDPRDGAALLADWVELWWAGQDLEATTEAKYRYLIDHHIVPAFGNRPVSTFTSPEEIVAWEKRTRRTIALRGPEKVWATSLQTLLLAERCALLSGRDDDVVMIVLTAYTGMRWGEVHGLERPACRLDRIQIDWQLRELAGRLEMVSPKDDSHRPVDLPPFLAALVSDQSTRTRGRCACPGRTPECGGRRGVYSHVSDTMRDELKTKLQRRWEESLAQRLHFGAASPVPLLNRLLEAARTKGTARGHLASA